MDKNQQDRTAMAEAMRWVSRITAVSFEMVLPGLAGLWLDNQIDTKILFTVVGFGAGMTLGMMHLMAMTKPPEKDLMFGCKGCGEEIQPMKIRGTFVCPECLSEDLVLLEDEE